MADERVLPKGPKSQPIDVIIYEIDMWRRSYAAIAPRRDALRQTYSDVNLYEYNLRIEGFLLHARNLLAFFTNRHSKQTDLFISQGWVSQHVDRGTVSALRKRARAVDRKYGHEDDTCHDEISKFLSHCVDERYVRPKSWDTDGLFADLDPILRDFETKFDRPPEREPEVRVTTTLGDAHHTATFSRFAIGIEGLKEPR